MDDIICRFLYAFLKVFIAGTHIERYRMTDKILAMPRTGDGATVIIRIRSRPDHGRITDTPPTFLEHTAGTGPGR